MRGPSLNQLEVKNSVIALSPTSAHEHATTAHELMHDWSRRGVGKNVEEQVKIRTLAKVQDQYRARGEYDSTYSINPYEGVARDVGDPLYDKLLQSTPGKRKVPIEELRELYSKGIQDNFKFSAFSEPGKTVRGLMGTLEEMKRSGKYSNTELKEASKKIIGAHKQYWELK